MSSQKAMPKLHVVRSHDFVNVGIANPISPITIDLTQESLVEKVKARENELKVTDTPDDDDADDEEEEEEDWGSCGCQHANQRRLISRRKQGGTNR